MLTPSKIHTSMDLQKRLNERNLFPILRFLFYLAPAGKLNAISGKLRLQTLIGLFLRSLQNNQK